MTLSEIRKNARESLSGKWGSAALLTFVYFLVAFGMGIVFGILSYIPLINLAAMVGFYVLLFPMAFGLIFSYMEIKKGNDVECGDFLTIGFKNFKRIWCIVGNIFKKIWLYLLLYFVLAIVIGFVIGITIIISVIFELPLLAIFGCLFTMLLIVGLIAIYVLLIIKSYLYAIADYIAWDNPNKSAKEAVDKSEELMKGHRIDFFLLGLSFIGWYILSIFTLGIGLFWLLPYMQTAYIIFYENIIKENKDDKELIGESKEKLEKLEKEMIEEKVKPTEKIKDSNSGENVTEVKEEDIEKIDILDDEGNIIK